MLGLELNPDAPKEHWTRIKALSRRLAEGWSDEYDNLNRSPTCATTFRCRST